MKINYNGVVRNMTSEEETEYLKMQAEFQPKPAEPTPEERINALEMAVLGLMDEANHA